VKEYPQFEAALSLLPGYRRMTCKCCWRNAWGAWRSKSARSSGDRRRSAINLPALFLIESEYALALLRAERTYVKSLIRGIESAELGGSSNGVSGTRPAQNTEGSPSGWAHSWCRPACSGSCCTMRG